MIATIQNWATVQKQIQGFLALLSINAILEHKVANTSYKLPSNCLDNTKSIIFLKRSQIFIKNIIGPFDSCLTDHTNAQNILTGKEILAKNTCFKNV